MTTAKSKTIEAGVSPLTQLPDHTDQDVIDLLANEQRLLLWGPSGSGKSSLLKHVINRKLNQSTSVLLCDPHGSRPKWGPSVDAIGFGENYQAILGTFRSLEALHTQRIKEVACGHPERDFDLVTVVIEELQALVEHYTAQKVDIGYYIRMFLTRTRKTGIDVVAVSQEVSVKAMGLEGFGKNRDAFAIAETSGRDGRNHRVFYTDERAQRLEFEAPPLWPDYLPVGVNQNRIFYLPPPPPVEQPENDLNPRQRMILNMFDAGKFTETDIAMAAYGTDGGRQLELVRNILRSNDRI